MYAVIKTGGKQYRVSQGDELKLEKLKGGTGDTITFEEVLLTADGENVQLGKPILEGSKVIGRIIRQDKHKKIVVQKYKRRKGYHRKRGHRQPFSLVKIEDIQS